MTISFKEKIGFLPYEKPILFNNGRIYPIEDYKKISSWIKKYSHRDGFYYPPLIHTITQRYEEENDQLMLKEEIVPNSSRPAHLFRLPASHYIEITDPVYTEDPKAWDGLFLTYLVAFHFGICLQFHDWWFDQRVPIKIDRDFYADHSNTELFINKAYKYWRKVSEDGKKRLTNILFMQARAKSYEWDWERFIIYYMVLDGCFKYLNVYYSISSKSHKDRIKAIINHFNMFNDKRYIRQIVDLRNDLFHESLWGGEHPCIHSSSHTWLTTTHLAKLNSRIIHAILGHNGEYIRSSWISRDIFLF